MSTRHTVRFCSARMRYDAVFHSVLSYFSQPSLLLFHLPLPFPRCWPSSGAGLSIRQGVKLLMASCALREDVREEREKGSESRTSPVISEKVFRATRSIGSFSLSLFSRQSSRSMRDPRRDCSPPSAEADREPVQGSLSLKGKERGGDETPVVGKFR